ncbi:DEAD/DEAH box helicase [Ferrimonas balearica]|uniref:DEAD/DEAH box helicase n=1 Tax=Ferrimonas balearica TaxID=44012 RepID=UPI001C9683A9|nr:DEAD/DEAH box helicase [Ferrimonas balearica]MBY5982263.1 DEAD/DEAH box helicase [Ferrimonas balearica]MBY6096717.1 DEAD/DEAH box helicase [Ferrimonas balearica]
MPFASLGLSPELARAVADKGYREPSPIQAQAIPAILAGKDVMAAAQTGTGKTAGFTLPMLQNLSRGTRARSNRVRALVLTPTRELAAQVAESVQTYGQNLPLRSVVVFGGVSINPQMQALRRGADVLVATPGRLLDLFSQNAVKFEDLELLVLDEADRMLDMGFIRDIRKILALLPKRRQNLLFSATFSGEIRELARGLLNQPVEVDVSPRNSTARTVVQRLHPVDKGRKPALISKLIREHNWHQVLIFTRTKHGANRLAQKLERDGIQAAAIHGNKSQGARTRALAGFKDGTVQALVATDIAARGLDIHQLPQVVNFDLPQVAEDYVHRIGRTGRAGAEGQAISLVCAEEFKLLQAIEKLIQKPIERVELAGFEPQEPLPVPRQHGNQPKRTDAAAAPKRDNRSKPRKEGDKPAGNDEQPRSRRRPQGGKPGGNGKPGNKPGGNGKPGNKPADGKSRAPRKPGEQSEGQRARRRRPSRQGAARSGDKN